MSRYLKYKLKRLIKLDVQHSHTCGIGPNPLLQGICHVIVILEFSVGEIIQTNQISVFKVPFHIASSHLYSCKQVKRYTVSSLWLRNSLSQIMLREAVFFLLLVEVSRASVSQWYTVFNTPKAGLLTVLFSVYIP